MTIPTSPRATSTLIQVVPILPPAISGVGDYASLLAQELQTTHGVETRFLVGDPNWRDERPDGSAGAAAVVNRRTSTALQALLSTATADTEGVTTVLLHYVGYGYARRGCPFWLVEALERWKHASPGTRRLVVLFHETYASGPMWSSAFWTSPWQRSLAARLGRVADARRITTGRAAAELRAVGGVPPAATVDVVPVFSNVGESTGLLPLAKRKRQMVVFGSGHWRQEAYTRHRDDLAATCARLGLEKVVDVGSPLGMTFENLLPVPIVQTGPLPAAQAGALFAESFAGYITYPVPYLGKSGIFAAYCAHGVLPVTFATNEVGGSDGLTANQQFLRGTENVDPASLQTIATAARRWYDGHDLATHAQGIARLMRPPTA